MFAHGAICTPGLMGTRRATSTAVDGFAGNMEVVREESGPTDTGCARGSPTGDSSQWCGGYAQVPAPKLCGTARGLASSNIPDTLTARVGAIP
jgi:hypothetical protein